MAASDRLDLPPPLEALRDRHRAIERDDRRRLFVQALSRSYRRERDEIDL